MAQLRRRQAELDATGVAIYLVSFDTRARARAHLRYRKFPYPTLVDESRAVYHAFGMGRGPWWQRYAPQALWRSLMVHLRARTDRHRRLRRIRATDGDILQRGGDVLVDPQGIVRIVHVTKRSHDRPTVDDLLRAFHAIPRLV